MKKVILTIVTMIILAAAGAGFFIFSGTYDVAATSKDAGFVSWALSTIREQSVESRAEGVTPPSETVLNDANTLREGFDHYNEICVVCHGAPGIEPGEAREGLNPKPPLLARTANEISLWEMFWVIKNGIKMTGMPAWGPTHSDEKIWAIVAFVKKLPEMTPEQYKAMQQQSTGEEHRNAHSSQQ